MASQGSHSDKPRKRSYSRFTEEELRLLRDSSLTNREVAKRTGRNIASVRLGRVHRGIDYPRERGRRLWIDDELDYLIEFAHLSDASIANALGREIVSIKNQRATLIAVGEIQPKSSPMAPRHITIEERTRRYKRADRLIRQGLDVVSIAHEVELSVMQVEDRSRYLEWLQRRQPERKT